MLETRRWDESVSLVSAITHAIAKSTKLQLEDAPEIAGAHKIQEGVYTRNLYIPRRLRGGVMAYLECLHYDYPSEFNALYRADQTGTYHGTSFQYPSRLKSVAAGIKTGILNYLSARTLTED